MKSPRARLVFCSLLLICQPLLLACQEQESKKMEASYGVYYGGLLREADELRISVAALPKLGFRLERQQPAAADERVVYRLERPGLDLPRVSQEVELLWAKDQLRLDQLLAWPDKVRSGYWSLRVTCAGDLLLDRTIYLSVEE